MQQPESNSETTDLREYVAGIAAAYVSGNATSIAELPELIESIHGALRSAHNAQVAPERPEPAVSIKGSVRPDYLVCLEDGKKLLLLKRYLRTNYNLSPSQYRERWGLPNDYPMVAPNYARRRSELAKKVGLGLRPRKRQQD